jgi:hypothetical protein|tara:strand:- start:394 stop:588 length:195 start_codon:yes stop_codon:yes gene_type:complete
MKIDIKFLLSFIPMLLSVGIIYGTLNTKVKALETRVDSVTQMQQDIAVIKEKIMWMESYLIGEK